MEEISKVDASVSVCMSVNNSLVCWGLRLLVQKNKNKIYLTPLAQAKKMGNCILALFIKRTEAGSDATSQQHNSRRYGDTLPGEWYKRTG
jgi:alkylation response protein AidB-like acyl-CoA dehydrogenase